MMEVRSSHPKRPSAACAPFQEGRAPGAKSLATEVGMLAYHDVVRTALDDLQRDGYCIVRRAVGPERIAACRAAFVSWADEHAAVCAEQRARIGRLPRLVNLHEDVPLFQALFAETESVLAIQDAYFAAETVIYTSLYYEQGSGQPYHRDAPYFATLPVLNRFLGVWFAFEATDGTNGSLSVFAGGHHVEVDKDAIARSLFPNLADVPPIDDALWVKYQDAVAARCRELGLKEHELHVAPGDVVIWDGMLPHSGTSIADPKRTRHSVVMHTIPVGTSVRHAEVFFNPDHGCAATPGPYAPIVHGRRMIQHGVGAHFG
jgi:phytanoyl-CoA hydroxylase